MSTKKYTIGVDFGTLSGRAVLIGVANGSEVAGAVKDYTHAVMDRFLPDRERAWRNFSKPVWWKDFFGMDVA